MKKIITGIAIVAAFCFIACGTPEPQKLRAITKIEELPTGECLYSVEGDTIPYIFIDAAGKYSVGQQF